MPVFTHVSSIHHPYVKPDIIFSRFDFKGHAEGQQIGLDQRPKT